MSAHLVASQRSRRNRGATAADALVNCSHGRRRTTWALRISLADIERDGPFSALRVSSGGSPCRRRRCGTRFADHRRRLTPIDEPLRFDGAAAPHCSLLGGGTRDLNLMHRGGNAALLTVHGQARVAGASGAMRTCSLPSPARGCAPTANTTSCPHGRCCGSSRHRRRRRCSKRIPRRHRRSDGG